VVAEPGSSAMLIESFGSLGVQALQRNAVTEVVIKDKAAINHVKLQREGGDTLHLTTSLVKLGADARYEAFQFSLGAALARNQIYAQFTGEGSQANISGAFLLRDRQHCDTTILVEHLVPRCGTRELLKAVLDKESRGVFQGKIIVAPGAQKTDSKQMAQALLLSEGAEFDSKPELEIFADDVVCGHGSTSGQIDEDLLFYLEARGIPEPEARALLIQAFVGEALERIEDEGLREVFANASAEWLGVSAG
jgi:FeS assembly protein SufD